MKKGSIQRNLPVILAISLPVALVLFVALLAFIPNLGPKPEYDFLYTKTQARTMLTPNAGCEVYANYYSIDQNQLTEKPFDISVFESRDTTDPCYGHTSVVQKDAPQLFIYKIKEDKSEQISFNDAQKLTLQGTLSSPDGFEVQKRIINNGGILDIFGARNEGGVYTSRKNSYIKLNFPEQESSYYDNDFSFISWVSQN